MTAPHTATAAAATRDRARVATADLRWRCPPPEAGISATSEAEPIRSVIGQDGAVDVLRFGLEIDAPGQNVCVRGLTGTGRSSPVQRLLEDAQPAILPVIDGEPAPPERIQHYVSKGLLGEADVEALRTKIEQYGERLGQLSERMHAARAEHRQRMRNLIEEEALEILTGWDTGLPDENGRYPEGTLLALAMERAAEFWRMTQPESSADPTAPSQTPNAAG